MLASSATEKGDSPEYVSMCPTCLPHIKLRASSLFGDPLQRGQRIQFRDDQSFFTRRDQEAKKERIRIIQAGFIGNSETSFTGDGGPTSRRRANTVSAFRGESGTTPIVMDGELEEQGLHRAGILCSCYALERCQCMGTPAVTQGGDDRMERTICRCFSCHVRRQTGAGVDKCWADFMAEPEINRESVEKLPHCCKNSTEWDVLDRQHTQSPGEYAAHSTGCVCGGSGVGCECVYSCMC